MYMMADRQEVDAVGVSEVAGCGADGALDSNFTIVVVHAEGSSCDDDGGVRGLRRGGDGRVVEVAEDVFLQTVLGVDGRVFGAPILDVCGHATEGSTKAYCKGGW